MGKKLKLANVRMSFPDIWHAKEFKTGDGKPRFSCTFLIEKDSANDKAIRAAIEEEAQEVYGEKTYTKLLAGMEKNANKYCYQDGDNKEYDGYQDRMYIACHNKGRPTILDADKTPLTEADGRPYAGCYVNAVIEIYAQKGENPGIRGGLMGIQFYREGVAFSGGRPASENDFDDVTEGPDADDLG